MEFKDWFNDDEHDLYNYPEEAMELSWNSAIERQWISADDELPKDARPVIVSGGCGHYSRKYKQWFTNMERDNFGEYQPIQWEVTHWMKLPSSPKVKS